MPRLAAVFLALLPLPAAADVHWLCGLSAELTRIVCIAETDPLDETAPPAAAAPGAVVNGTRFPLDPRRRYIVDLWSPPTEGASVEFLARATICYRSPGCTVTVALPDYLRPPPR